MITPSNIRVHRCYFPRISLFFLFFLVEHRLVATNQVRPSNPLIALLRCRCHRRGNAVSDISIWYNLVFPLSGFPSSFWNCLVAHPSMFPKVSLCQLLYFLSHSILASSQASFCPGISHVMRMWSMDSVCPQCSHVARCSKFGIFSQNFPTFCIPFVDLNRNSLWVLNMFFGCLRLIQMFSYVGAVLNVWSTSHFEFFVCSLLFC